MEITTPSCSIYPGSNTRGMPCISSNVTAKEDLDSFILWGYVVPLYVKPYPPRFRGFIEYTGTCDGGVVMVSYSTKERNTIIATVKVVITILCRFKKSGFFEIDLNFFIFITSLVLQPPANRPKRNTIPYTIMDTN